MAINIPIITEFADAGLKSARGAFDQFKAKVSEAEGGMGKFKAGAGVAFDSIKANAGSMALGAGAAIGGFALKAIGDFKDLALSVDDFRNRTNLSLDASSRWASLAGDLGIQTDSVIKVFDRLGKTIETSTKPLDQLGVSVVKTAEGTTDLEATFLKTIDALNKIEDPAKRAKLQADLFGRGWQDAAEIINMSSEEIRASLAGVGDFEIIDEAEIQKAKDLRAAQDALGDAFANLSVTLGEALIPALTTLTKVLVPVLEAIGKFSGTLDKGMSDAIAKAREMGYSFSAIARELGADDEQSLTYMASVLGMTLDQLYSQLDTDLVPETYRLEQAWKEGSRAFVDANTTADGLSEALVGVDEALSELKGNVDERQAWRNLQDELDRVKDAAIKAFTEATPAALRDSEAALDRARLKVGEYIGEIDSIPEEQKTEFIAMLDTASVQQIEAILAHLARVREVQFMPSLPPGQGGISEIGSGGRPIGEAPLSLGVGRRMATGNVTVNVSGSVISENDLVETVRKGLVNAQRNGAGLVYTNR